MNKAYALLTCLTVLFLSSACMRSDSVVSVRKDGSGTITVNQEMGPQLQGMLSQFEALGDMFSKLSSSTDAGAGSTPDLGALRGIIQPDEEKLKANAVNFGEGVRYQSHKAVKSADGWAGHKAVYTFDDIRKVRVDQRSAMSGVKAPSHESAGEISFALEGDVLTISSQINEKGVESILEQDGLKSMGASSAQSMKMAAETMKGMRFSYHVQAESGIEQTDADHVSGNQITLFDADVAKILSDPNFIALMEKAENDPKSITPEEYREVMKKVDGMTVESKQIVKVTLK